MKHRHAARLVVLVAASVLLAGCATEDGGGTDAPPIDPVTGLEGAAFGAAVRVGPDVGEPGLAIGEDGTLWAHYPGGLHKSMDGGATWQNVPFGPQNVIVGGDADLTIGEDGSLYYTDLEALVAISVFKSSDGGATWVGNPVASNVPVVDRQWLLAGPDAARDMAESVYLVFNQLMTGIKVMKSTTGGIVYDAPTVVQTSQTCYRGNIAVSPVDGTLYIADCDDGGPRAFVSTDGAQSFESRRVADREGFANVLFPIVAVDAAGNAYMTWSEQRDGGADVLVSVSTDRGATWSEAAVVNAPGTTAIMPWVEAGSAGRVGVAYYVSPQRAPPQDMPDDAEWFVEYAVSVDAASGAPKFARSRVADDVIQKGYICHQGTACSESLGGPGGRNLLDFFQVKADAEGRAHVIWADGCDGCDSPQTSRSAKVTYASQTAGPLLAG